MVYVKQHSSSLLSLPDIEHYVKDIGDRRFLDLEHPDSFLKVDDQVSIFALGLSDFFIS